MRSTEQKIVPFRNLKSQCTSFEDINRFGTHPAYQWGGNVNGSHKRMKYWGRREVVDTYLRLKKERGGDPILSAAIQLGQDWRMVEKVLEVEIGRMPQHIKEAEWEHGAGSSPEAAWHDHQRMLNKKYGPVVTP